MLSKLFVVSGILIGGEAQAPCPPPGYAYGGTSLFGPSMYFFALYVWDIIGWAMYEIFFYICLGHHWLDNT